MAVTSATDDSLTVATLMTTEDGGFTLNGEDVPETVTLEDGRMYALTLSDGEWTATFQPREVSVALGASGDSATLRTTEAGGFTRGGEPFAGGPDMVVTAANTNRYVLTQAEDGSWSAQYLPWTPTIALGQHGGSRQFRIAENGDLTSNGTNVPVGALILGDNGLRYRISRQDDQWTASYAPEPPVTIDLGASGTKVSFSQNEDGSWLANGAPIASGGTLSAENDNVYTVTLGPGGWSASFQAETLAIAGTGYTAVRKEDRSGFSVDVAGTAVDLANDGFGDVGSFRVSSSGEGASRQLTGMRFDSDIKTTALGGAGDDVASDITDGVMALALNADDEDTTANEKNTRLTITLENDPEAKTAEVAAAVGDLFDDGMAAGSYDRFVAKALGEIQKRLDSVERFIGLIDLADDDDLDAARYAGDLNRLWRETNDQLRTIFGSNFELEGSETGAGDPGTRTVGAPLRRGSPDTTAIRDTLQDVITALSSEDEFIAATREDSDGVFEAQKLSEANATSAFERETHEAKVRFGNTENTRFGAVWRQRFTHATDKDPGDLQQGTFAYSPLQKTQNRQIVNAALPTGVASYRGQTVIMADESTNTPAFYTGDIEVGLRLTTNRVTGLVTNLLDENGAALRSFGYAVQSINLPQATLGHQATYRQTAGARATVRYQLEAGHPAPTVVADTTFTGTILGRSNDAATATIGQWTLDGAGLDLLGAFGAEQAAAPEVPRPTIDDDGAEAHMTSQMVGTLANGADGATDARFSLQIKDGNIRFLNQMKDANDVVTEATIKASAATLFNDADGRLVLKGTKFTTAARDNIQALLTRFNRIVPLGADGNSQAEKDTYNSERTRIWTAVDTELNKIFGPARLDREDDAMGDARLGSVPTTDGTFRDELEDIIAALGSSRAFTDAFASRGVFERDAAVNYANENGRFENSSGQVLLRYNVNVVNAEAVAAVTVGAAAIPLTSGGYVREYGKAAQHWMTTNAAGEIVSGGSNVDTALGLGFTQVGTITYTTDPDTLEPIRTETNTPADTFRNAAGEALKVFEIDGVNYFGAGTPPVLAADATGGDYHTDADGQILAASSARPPNAAAYDLPGTTDVDESLSESFYLTSRSGAKGDVFNEVEWEAIIEYRATDFTRFGFWRRQATDHADRKRAPSGSGNLGVSYAYSPLENTIYVAGDPNYPAGAQRMTYTGSTLAYDSARKKRYEGVVNLAVNWGELGETSTLVLEISGLQTRDLGEPILLRVAGTNNANDQQAIENIRFQETFNVTAGEGLSFSAADIDNLDSLALETARGEVDVVLSGATGNQVNGASFLVGRFVGMNAEGPLAAMGRWSLSGIERWDPAKLDQTFANGGFNDLNLIGAFGADLVQ